MTTVFTATNYTIPNNGWVTFPFIAPYNWDNTKGLVVEVCDNFSGYQSGNNVAAQYTTTSFNSTYKIYNYTGGDICASTANSYPYSTTGITNRPIIKFKECPAGNAPFPFTWRPNAKNSFFIDDSTKQNPRVYVPASTKYYVYTMGRNGCSVRDSIAVYVPTHSYYYGPKDTAICYGDKFSYYAGSGTGYTWYENGFNTPTTLSCNNCANPVAQPLVNTDYTLVISDTVDPFHFQTDCPDTFYTHVTVKPLPIVHIINNDTTLKYGQSIQLAASGAYLYSWAPVSSLNNPNIVNPIATPTEPTQYTVIGIGNNGCRNFDTVNIGIDYRDNLFIPSGFSPNNDGKNDVFRIKNFSFQKITEFRVFNRWGQDIFTATDNHGWDGTWKGVPQDIGVYNYLIRVAFPDGFVETYKGDVTLIR